MTTSNKPKAVFWIIAVVALLWNLAGFWEFIKTAFMVETYAALYDETQMEAIRNTPIWALIVFGISTVTGVLGSLFLLLRKKMAITLFAISVVTVIIHVFGSIVLLNGMELFGVGQGLIFPLVIIVLDIFFYWFSKWSYKKGWLH